MDDLWNGLIEARYTGDVSKLKDISQRLRDVAGKHADGVIGKLLNYVEKNETSYKTADGKEKRI